MKDWPPPLLQVSQLPEKAIPGQEELCPLSLELRVLIWYLHYIPTNSVKVVNTRKDANQPLIDSPSLNFPSVS